LGREKFLEYLRTHNPADLKEARKFIKGKKN
jgi:hypothetical protein